MTTKTPLRTIALAMLSGFATACVNTAGAAHTAAETKFAAEISLRAKAVCEGTLVTVADVAEIRTNRPEDGRRLADTELFPAPAAGSERVLRIRELQDLLSLRGVNLKACRFAGSSVTHITSGKANKPARTPVRTIASQVDHEQAARRVEQVIRVYLRQVAPDIAHGDIGIEPAADLVQWLAHTPGRLIVRGGRAPYTGRQQFQVVPQDAHQQPISIIANVAPPKMVVVPTRPLHRGELVQINDLELRPLPQGQRAIDPISDPREIAGMETTRSIAAGQPVSRRSVRSPLLVKRSEVVIVRSVAPGIVIRTHGKVLQEGSRGDLVTVESLEDRTRFTARVTDSKEVTVYAHGNVAESGARANHSARSTRVRPTAYRQVESQSTGRRPAGGGLSARSNAMRPAAIGLHLPPQTAAMLTNPTASAANQSRTISASPGRPPQTSRPSLNPTRFLENN